MDGRVADYRNLEPFASHDESDCPGTLLRIARFAEHGLRRRDPEAALAVDRSTVQLGRATGEDEAAEAEDLRDLVVPAAPAALKNEMREHAVERNSRHARDRESPMGTASDCLHRHFDTSSAISHLAFLGQEAIRNILGPSATRNFPIEDRRGGRQLQQPG